MKETYKPSLKISNIYINTRVELLRFLSWEQKIEMQAAWTNGVIVYQKLSKHNVNSREDEAYPCIS